MKNGRIVRPAENLDDIRAERSAQLNGISARNDELGKVNDDCDLVPRFFLSYRLEVETAKQIAVDQFQRRPWFAGLKSCDFIAEDLLEPLSPILETLGYSY